MHIRTDGSGFLSRRTFLRNVTAGAAGVSMLGWKENVALQAEELRKRGMACILLFMRGGPSQLETFDPKPGTSNGGPAKDLSTAAGCNPVAEHKNNVPAAMNDSGPARAMPNRQGEQTPATDQFRPAYAHM